ncbi:hypothetical protein [Frigoriglobus tundricola]|uniref:Uncharacterized protein n=1 Tax=Frigoriglobus tundricola TaxID=2774151 RepID=A0A6M5YIK9_9BACT|nr:hypothetical protein [Frigoriglobus tundricola]QJW93374.1 hypothetical protein FTUN_0880 [Frigoriglobus tundricola]
MTRSLLLDPADPAAVAPDVFRRVWRTGLDEPGFALLRLARAIDSVALRRAMMELVAAFPVAFVPERFGRFDQKVSSKFHRDGAPLASLLVLGYEPTAVRSRFWIADASAAAVAAGLPLPDYLAAHNPMFPAGEAKLAPFITELDLPHGAAVKPGFAGDRSRGSTSEEFILVVNNSLLPFGNGNSLGVLHKAVVTSPDSLNTSQRVINSVGFTPRTASAPGLPPAEHERFLTRDDLD